MDPMVQGISIIVTYKKMDLMDPRDKYLARSLNTYPLDPYFFLILIKKKMDPMDSMDKYLALKFVSSLQPGISIVFHSLLWFK